MTRNVVQLPIKCSTVKKAKSFALRLLELMMLLIGGGIASLLVAVPVSIIDVIIFSINGAPHYAISVFPFSGYHISEIMFIELAITHIVVFGFVAILLALELYEIKLTCIKDEV